MPDTTAARNAEDIKRNAADIKELTVNLTRLAALVEADRGTMRTAVEGINRLGERIGALVGMEKDICAIKEILGEKTGDIRTIRHDLNNAKNSLGGIALLGDKVEALARTVAEHGVMVAALERWRSQAEGAGGVIRGVGRAAWAVSGAGVTALALFLLKAYFLAAGQ